MTDTAEATEAVAEVAEAPQVGSLLTGVQATPETKPDEGPAIERPEWVLDKYVTEDRSLEESIGEQAKAYVELQKQFGAFTGAPEAYELALPEGIEGQIDEDLPQYGQFLEIAKAANMDNATANQLFGLFASYQNDMMSKVDADFNAQKEMLGPNADQRIQGVVQWAGNNLDDSQMGVLESMTTTADQIEVLEHIIAKTRNTPTIKTHESSAPTGGFSKHDFDEAVASDRFRTDRAYRESIRKKGAMLFGDG